LGFYNYDLLETLISCIFDFYSTNMQVLTLPDLLKENQKEELFIYLFESEINAQKTKVKLNTNLLSFLIEGSKEIHYNNECQTFGETHFLLAKSGNCLMTEQLSENKQYKSILFFFCDQFLAVFKAKHESLSLSENTKPRKPFLGFVYDDFINNYVKSLRYFLVSNEKPSQAILQIKLDEILLYLIERDGIEILEFLRSEQNTKKEYKFTKIIESNIFSKLALEELAFLCNMSLSTFKREFQKNYGIPPSRWFQNKRLEQSATLLKIKQERPSDIYHIIGYESLSSFTQSFKQKFGVTPKQFQLQED
jgi:AraC family transcriptional regulator, exoenzyme S synthesis regulatory protein ExsA